MDAPHVGNLEIFRVAASLGMPWDKNQGADWLRQSQNLLALEKAVNHTSGIGRKTFVHFLALYGID